MRVKNWIRYLKNFTLNKFTNNKIPYSAQIELTLRCNASCPFCSFPVMKENDISHEMTTKQVKYLIDQIANLGVNSLSFTGGEPTLRHDLPELIYHAGVEHDIMIGIATNGFLMPKLFRENGKLNGLDYILLSLDFPYREQHNRIRGLRVFDKVIETINFANERDIKVIISTVVMKENLNYLRDLCELAENLNCSIEIFPCENIVRDFPNTRYIVDHIERLIPDLSTWAKSVDNLRKEYKNILTDPISVAVVQRGGFGGFPKYNQDLLRCHVAEAYLFVRYDGYIDLPCKIHPIQSFNALKLPLSKIYNSLEAMQIMNKHDDFDFCENCRLGCAIASSMPARWKTLASKFIMGYFKGNLK